MRHQKKKKTTKSYIRTSLGLELAASSAAETDRLPLLITEFERRWPKSSELRPLPVCAWPEPPSLSTLIRPNSFLAFDFSLELREFDDGTGATAVPEPVLSMDERGRTEAASPPLAPGPKVLCDGMRPCSLLTFRWKDLLFRNFVTATLLCSSIWL